MRAADPAKPPEPLFRNALNSPRLMRPSGLGWARPGLGSARGLPGSSPIPSQYPIPLPHYPTLPEAGAAPRPRGSPGGERSARTGTGAPRKLRAEPPGAARRCQLGTGPSCRCPKTRRGAPNEPGVEPCSEREHMPAQLPWHRLPEPPAAGECSSQPAPDTSGLLGTRSRSGALELCRKSRNCWKSYFVSGGSSWRHSPESPRRY